MLKGRQIVCIILAHIKTDRHIDQQWQLEDLFNLDYPGDKNLWAFRCMWHKIVGCLAGDIIKTQLRKTIRRKLEDSQALKEDIPPGGFRVLNSIELC